MAMLVSTDTNHDNTTDTINPVNHSADTAGFAGSAGTPGGTEESYSRMLPVTHPVSTPLVEETRLILVFMSPGDRIGNAAFLPSTRKNNKPVKMAVC
jgi:hypothetical protein